MALFVKKSKYGILFLILISVIATVFLQYEQIDLLIHIDSTLLAIPFICAGYLLKGKIIPLVQGSSLLMKFISVSFLLLWLVLVPFNGKIDMNTCKTGESLFIFYITATIATFVFLRICNDLYGILKGCKLVMGGGKIVFQ